ncbi:MAG: hypothetical protein VB142_09325 [Burkholderia sp.]
MPTVLQSLLVHYGGANMRKRLGMAVVDASKDRRQSGSIIFKVMDSTLVDTEKPGSRKRRLNHSREFRRRIAIAAC